MCTVRVKTSLLPVGTSEFVHVSVKLLPELGSVQDQLAGFVFVTNVVPGGNLSSNVAPLMSSDPVVETVMV